MKYLFPIIFLLLITINTLENSSKNNDFKDSLKTYDKLNHFETIIQNQTFIINSTLKSIAYFDSFDKNSIIYISKSYDDCISFNDERIQGKFYVIEPNTTYYIRTFSYSFPSVIQKYVYPSNLDESEININDDIEEINYLYLEKNKRYTLNFAKNKIKKMIKLSHKTLNSKVKIIIDGNEESQLKEKNLYYKIQEDFTGKLIFEIEENNAFIEFLSDIGDYKILTDISYENSEVDNNAILIQIPKTQKSFNLYLTSDEPFSCALSYGFSILSNYYYYSKLNTKITAAKQNNGKYVGSVILVGAFKNVNLLEHEFLSFAIILERSPNQKIYLEYYQYSTLDKIYDEEMSEETCEKIINNLKDILEIYVYTDIAKNPPDIPGYQNYHHNPIDLKGELDKVSKVNRKFYEFYQEIEKILTSTKDLHFNIYAHQTPKGIQFGQYSVVLQFNFEVRKNEKGQYKIFIKKNNIYDILTPEEKQFIDDHLEIPVRKINEIDPFDYIQNWSKYKQTKNPHAQFTNIIDQISYFYLCRFPVEYSDLYNEYEFEDNKSIKIWYYNNFKRVNDNDIEFNNYFLKVFKSQKAPFELPQLNIIRDRFMISKGFKKKTKILKNENEKIKWDILYEEEEYYYLKCRFDKENKVNVLIQNSFNFYFERASEKALDCARLFYSNEYPIIIIQDHNGGGNINLLMLMHQIFQIRTTDRSYESFRLSDISKKYFNNIYWNFVDIEKCKIGTSFNDTEEIIDHYIKNNIDIEHKRTKVIDRFPLDYRKSLNNFREEYFNSQYAKKPTDIIIFTDSFSYSATSGFIKGFQSTGGAIVVGYYGNPTKPGTDFFDSSQSDSDVRNLETSEMYKNLYDSGFTIIGVTCGESYDDFYQKPNPIPREYTLEPVDYRVDIYSRYSDDLYEKFIKEGLEVHKLFNNGSYCNAKNDKLLLHDEKCKTIKGDEYAHGGFKCNNESRWDKGQCEAYYCDIGYYYDHFEGKCKKECTFEENKKVFIIHEKEYNKEFKIGYNITFQFKIFYNENHYYSLSTSEESIQYFPKFVIINSNSNLNVINTKYKVLPITIKSINPSSNPNIDLNINHIQTLYFNSLFFLKGKSMRFFQSLNDSIFYCDNILNSSKGKIKLAKYNNQMDSEDIIKISDKYFSDIGKINFLEKNQIYILYHEFNDYEEIDYYLFPKNEENIKITDDKRNIFYLEKNKKYILDFIYKTLKNTMIKLSRKTINAEVTLKDENIKLNSKNLYYAFRDGSSSKLNVEIGKEDALIEILSKKEDSITEIIDLQKKTEFNLNKEFNFIKIPKNYSSQIITFNLNKKGKSILAIYHDYYIPGYSWDCRLNENENGIILSNFSFNITEHYKKGINLMKNEYYCLIIQASENDLNINVEIKLNENDQEESDNKENKDKSGLKSWLKRWQIYIIIVGSVVFLLLVNIVLLICLYKRKDANKEIEDKVENLTEIGV